MNFQESDAQFTQVNAELQKSLSYYLLSNQRMETIYNYLVKITSKLSKFLKKSPKTGPEIYGKRLVTDISKPPVSPGNSGRTSTYFQDFCGACESVKNGQKTLMDGINKQMIPTLKLFLEQRKVFFEQAEKNASELAKKRTNLQNAIKKLYQQYTACASNSEKLTVKIAKTKDPKQVESLHSNFISNCKSYVELTSKIHEKLELFNVAHTSFITNSMKTKDNIYNQEPKRMMFLKGLFSNLISIYKMVGKNYMKFRDVISDIDGDWASEFTVFANSQNIVRTGLFPSLFQRYPFSFEDPQLTYEVVYNRGYIDFPCYAATVKEEYKFKEICVKQNQRIFIHENLNNRYVVASIPKVNKMFYIAVENIEVDERKNTGLIKGQQIKLSPNHLEVQTGELVFILKDEQEGILCENVFGEKGIVQPEFIIVNNNRY